MAEYIDWTGAASVPLVGKTYRSGAAGAAAGRKVTTGTITVDNLTQKNGEIMAEYIEWTGTVKLPAGPWIETHEFTGEIRPYKKGEWYLLSGYAVIATYDNLADEIPILRPKKPKWQPPEHLVGTGWRLRIHPGSGSLLVDAGSSEVLKGWAVINKEGLTPIGTIMQLDPNNLPDLQPGEEIVL